MYPFFETVLTRESTDFFYRSIILSISLISFPLRPSPVEHVGSPDLSSLSSEASTTDITDPSFSFLQNCQGNLREARSALMGQLG